MTYTDYFSPSYLIGSLQSSLKMGEKLLQSAGVIRSSNPEVKLPSSLQNLDVPRLVRNGGPVVQVAAFSGAIAVVLGAYGSHTLPEKEAYEERRIIYETANRYHFFHTLALLAAPLCRHPKTVAMFMGCGMALFCGSCYYHALTGEKKLRKVTPIGGLFLICGWLAMLF